MDSLLHFSIAPRFRCLNLMELFYVETWAQVKLSRKKAQKTQKAFLASFVPYVPFVAKMSDDFSAVHVSRCPDHTVFVDHCTGNATRTTTDRTFRSTGNNCCFPQWTNYRNRAQQWRFRKTQQPRRALGLNKRCVATDHHRFRWTNLVDFIFERRQIADYSQH